MFTDASILILFAVIVLCFIILYIYRPGEEDSCTDTSEEVPASFSGKNLIMLCAVLFFAYLVANWYGYV